MTTYYWPLLRALSKAPEPQELGLSCYRKDLAKLVKDDLVSYHGNYLFKITENGKKLIKSARHEKSTPLH